VPPSPSVKKPTPPTAGSGKNQKKKWLTLAALITSTPFIIAIGVHLLALLAVGSVVIFKGGNPLAMFSGERVDSGDAGAEAPAPPSNEEPSPQEDSAPMAETTPTPTEITETTDLLSLSTPSPTSSFAPTTPAKNPTPPSLGSGGSTGKGGSAGGAGPKRARTGKGSLFGFEETMEDDLIGTMYDLKLEANGKKTTGLGDSDTDFYKAVRGLLAGSRVNESALRRYFCVPKKLGATQIFIPSCDASEAPKVFQVADKVKPNYWVIHYKGRFSPPVSGQYRFVGKADDLLWVAVEGRTVLEAHWDNQNFLTSWRPKDHVNEHSIYDFMGGNTDGDRQRAFLTYGDWMNLEAGKPKDLEILLGEYGGGRFFGVLMIQQQGTEDKKVKSKERPLIPLFITAEPNAQQKQTMRNSKLEFPREFPVFAASQKGGDPSPAEPAKENSSTSPTPSTPIMIDDAGGPAYNDDWKEDKASGTGFGNWILKSNGNPEKKSYAGFYLAKEQEKPGIAPLATSGKAWGIFADGEGFQETCAFRPFSSPLAAGQCFSVELITPNPKSNSGTTGSIGLTLRSGNASEKPTDYNQGARFEFTALEGKPNYQIFDGSDPSDSGNSIPIGGVRLEFTLKDKDLYDLRITPLGGGTPIELKDRKLGGTAGAPLESLAIFNRDSEANAFFNKLCIKP